MHAFDAMNTVVTVAVPGCSDRDEALLAMELAALFADTEQRFSRFRPESELSRLNRATGPTSVSPELFDALVRARRYVEETDGIFDPAVGGALRALGYDRSFAAGALDRDRPASAPVAARFLEVRLDARTRTVERPPHLHIDLGGLVKGRTADEAAALLPSPAAIDAGGDGCLHGAGPRGEGWPVDIEDPAASDRTLLTLVLTNRAVATSAPNRRTWRVGATTAHHLVDPRTGRSAASDLAQVTVVAATAEVADVLAKTVLILGAAAGRRFLERRPETAGVLVGRDGSVAIVGALEVRDVA